MYKYIRNLWKTMSGEHKEMHRLRMVAWRKENAIVKIDRPTRLDRARSVGYKAKKGYVLARVRVNRGGRKREQIKKGRRSKTSRRQKIVGKSYQWIAEERVQRKFKNLEVLNSYFVGKDGIHYFYEVILVDPYRPEIKKDPKMNWICARSQTNRVFRGKTSFARKSRGLRKKGIGAEKLRPSRRANKGRSK